MTHQIIEESIDLQHSEQPPCENSSESSVVVGKEEQSSQPASERRTSIDGIPIIDALENDPLRYSPSSSMDVEKGSDSNDDNPTESPVDASKINVVTPPSWKIPSGANEKVKELSDQLAEVEALRKQLKFIHESVDSLASDAKINNNTENDASDSGGSDFDAEYDMSTCASDGVDEDARNSSFERANLESKLSQLEAKIEAAVDFIFDEKIHLKCLHCERMEDTLNIVEAEKNEAFVAVEEMNVNLSLADRAILQLEGRVETSDEEVRRQSVLNQSLDEQIHLLNGELETTRLEKEATTEVAEIMTNELNVLRSRQKALNNKVYKLEVTIDLLVEEHRGATEKLVDAEEQILHAALDGNDIANRHIAELEEENDQLERKVTKLNKEMFQAKDKVNFVMRQNEGNTDKLKEKLKDSDNQIAQLKKELEDTKQQNEDMITSLNERLEALGKEKDESLAAMSELVICCEKLTNENEESVAKMLQLENEKNSTKKSLEELSISLNELTAEKSKMEQTITAQSQEISDLRTQMEQKQKEAKDHVNRLSNEVVFAHDEISRLCSEKTALEEESESQLETMNSRLKELREESQRKSKEYQELWAKSNNTYLEKESAVATVKQLQNDKEKLELCMKERDALSQQVDVLKVEKDERKKQIEKLIKTEGILKEMNALLESENKINVTLAKKELETEIEELKKENKTLSSQVEELKHLANEDNSKLKSELAAKTSEEEDLRWKISALKQNMDLRLNEKDTRISQLDRQLENYFHELQYLKNEKQKQDLESLASTRKAISNLEQMLESQQIELEQKDVAISNLRIAEKHYKSEILRMQSKVESMETWLHESLTFTAPMKSPFR